MKRIINLLCIILLTIVLVGCGGNSTKTDKNVDKDADTKNVTTTEKENIIDRRFNADGSFKLESAPNTEESLKELLDKSKEDCDEYNSIPKIIDTINSYMIDPWKDNVTMEQLIYFGNIIEKNKYSTTEEKQIGTKTVNITKYVYRGLETKEDAEIGKNILLDKLKEYRK